MPPLREKQQTKVLEKQPKRGGGGWVEESMVKRRGKNPTLLFSPYLVNESPIKTLHFETLASSYLKDFEVTGDTDAQDRHD